MGRQYFFSSVDKDFQGRFVEEDFQPDPGRAGAKRTRTRWNVRGPVGQVDDLPQIVSGAGLAGGTLVHIELVFYRIVPYLGRRYVIAAPILLLRDPETGPRAGLYHQFGFQPPGIALKRPSITKGKGGIACLFSDLYIFNFRDIVAGELVQPGTDQR